jgi:DNA-binding transcriptional LysR family regulator
LLLVSDESGLTAFTTSLFADYDLPMRRYPGEAASYQVLEEWAPLGRGSALLPVSKLTNRDDARELHHARRPVAIGYQAVWRANSRDAGHVATLVDAIVRAHDA